MVGARPAFSPFRCPSYLPTLSHLQIASSWFLSDHAPIPPSITVNLVLFHLGEAFCGSLAISVEKIRGIHAFQTLARVINPLSETECQDL